jgi:RNA polymerase sigma-70 factor, ECF subfamily
MTGETLTVGAAMSKRPSDHHDRFARLYAQNLSSILGYAVRRCADPADAADVAAEVFVAAWRRLEDVPEDAERLWLFGVARRALANHHRGQVRRSKLADRLRDELRTRPVTVEPDPAMAAVMTALKKLPERDREILLLAAWDGLTPAEIAAVEDVPAATVRSRLMRARGRLRRELGGPVPAAAAVQRDGDGGHVPAVHTFDSTTRSTS